MQIDTGTNALIVGGMAGDNTASIDQSHSDTRVLGSSGFNVGGLVGSHDAGSITNSYVVKRVGEIGEGSYIGGLIGILNSGGVVSTSYSVGKVVAKKSIACGGLVGRSFSGTVSQSYWDSDTSGCGGAGSPLTDEQFKTQLPQGFDPKIWGQSPSINNGYPYLLANPPQ
jgi:hypothetical protein